MRTDTRSPLILREALALAQMGLLMPRTSHALRETAPSQQLTVFIHGYMATGGVFGPMADRLAQSGVATKQLHFTYVPWGSIAEHAARLEQLVRDAHGDGPVHIVGHSLGGLIGRYYCQVMHRPVSRLVCLATPHKGTLRAQRWSALPLAREIAPGSSTLRLLDETAGNLRGVRVCSIVAAGDTTVTPVDSAVLEGHCVVRLANVGHQSILFDDEARMHVGQWLRDDADV